MNRIFKSFVLVCVILLQTTILSHFSPFGVIPNYVLAAAVAICVISPETDSVVICAVAGFFVDAFSGTPFGINALVYMYIAIVLVIISDMIYSKSVVVFAPVCFVFSFLYESFQGIVSFLLRSAEVDVFRVLKISCFVAIINTVIFVPVYVILSKVKIEKKRKGIKYEQ